MERKYMYSASSGSSSAVRRPAQIRNMLDRIAQNFTDENSKAAQSAVNKVKSGYSADKPGFQKPRELKIDTGKSADTREAFPDNRITSEKLQEAIIWSEILGKPVSRRRRAGYR